MIPIRDTIPARNPPIATWTLIVVNAVVFLLELTMAPPELEYFARLFGIVPARYMHAEWAAAVGLSPATYWPFLTSMFLHASGLHLLGNMWALWIFGDNVEDRMGPGRFVAFYLICGLIAAIVHVVTNPDSTLPTLGASGAIAGVMGAYFLLFPHSRIIVMFPLLFLPLFFELPAVAYLAVWALSQVFSGSLSRAVASTTGGIAWWAHVGGFAAGLILQFFFVRRGRDYRRLARDEYGDEAAWVPAAQWRRHG
jgi:membrane associated rhomboid family serine protease